jgi:mRNA interferase HigB
MHPEAAKPLQLWRKAVEAKAYPNFAALKAVFGSIDKARSVAAIHFNRQMLFIRYVFTHKQYDRWSPP